MAQELLVHALQSASFFEKKQLTLKQNGQYALSKT